MPTARIGPVNGGWPRQRPVVADPRMPSANDKLIAIVRALDGTWHRPFTTLELACPQSLVEPEEYLELDGLSDQGWRERIGNAVPPDAARAITEVMGTTLLLAESGETFVLSATPVWVRGRWQLLCRWHSLRWLCNGLFSDQTGHGHKCGNDRYTESPFRNAERLSRSLDLVLRGRTSQCSCTPASAQMKLEAKSRSMHTVGDPSY